MTRLIVFDYDLSGSLGSLHRNSKIQRRGHNFTSLYHPIQDD